MTTAEKELINKLVQCKRRCFVILGLMAEYKQDNAELMNLNQSLHIAASEAFECAESLIRIQPDTIAEKFQQLSGIYDRISGVLTFIFMSDRKEKTVFTPSDVAALWKMCYKLNLCENELKELLISLKNPGHKKLKFLIFNSHMKKASKWKYPSVYLWLRIFKFQVKTKFPHAMHERQCKMGQLSKPFSSKLTWKSTFQHYFIWGFKYFQWNLYV